jgi:hypothetical protein
MIAAGRVDWLLIGLLFGSLWRLQVRARGGSLSGDWVWANGSVVVGGGAGVGLAFWFVVRAAELGAGEVAHFAPGGFGLARELFINRELKASVAVAAA